jgi:glycosyltransferase involved in cell wall biosynthesis
LSPIILINHLLEPPGKITGISNYLFFLLKALLQRKDFDFVLATSWAPNDLPIELRQTDRLRIYTFPFHRSQPRNILAQLSIIPKLMRRTGACLEFDVNPVGSFSGSWPKISTVHDLYYDVMPSNYPRRHILWWRIFFLSSIRRSKFIICVSNQTKSDLILYYPSASKKAVVVHEASGLRPSKPVSYLRPSTYGLFVGNISPNKNIFTLIAAMDLLAKRGRDIKIYHVGRDERGKIQSACREIGTMVQLQTLGRVSEKELVSLYENATFLACPSSYEGFCLPVAEAQAFGVPVIASDIPVLREVGSDGALFFPSNDANAMANQIEMILADQSRWRTVFDAALQNSRNFSWTKAAEETAGIFLRALS